MTKYLFRSKKIRALVLAGVMAGAAALPVSSASAQTSTLFATLQGTSVLGTAVPVLGTQGWYVTLPVGSNVFPGETLVWGLLDFTVKSEVKVGNVEIVYLYLDPYMTR